MVWHVKARVYAAGYASRVLFNMIEWLHDYQERLMQSYGYNIGG